MTKDPRFQTRWIFSGTTPLVVVRWRGVTEEKEAVPLLQEGEEERFFRFLRI